jgi:divalent metal cation (Fe/Co/Zn/Cd) transporter
VSFDLTKGTVNTLLGQPPDDNFLRKISETAMVNTSIKGVHDIIVHKYGQVNLVTLHIEISDKFSAMEIHDISEEVQEIIEKKIPNTYALVHPDPLNTDHKDYVKISEFLNTEVSENKKISSYHDLRIVGEGRYSRILFDIELEKCLSEPEMREERRKIAKKILKKFEIPAVIKIEQKFKYSVNS